MITTGSECKKVDVINLTQSMRELKGDNSCKTTNKTLSLLSPPIQVTGQPGHQIFWRLHSVTSATHSVLIVLGAVILKTLMVIRTDINIRTERAE